MTSASDASRTRPPRWRQWLGIVLFAVAVVFIVGAGADVVRRLAAGQLSFRLSDIAIAALLFGGAYLSLCWGFLRFVAHHAVPPPPSGRVAEMYFRSLLFRYLPGKVAVPAVRAAAGAELGVAPALLGASAVLEMLAWLSTGALGCALVGMVTGLPRAWPGMPSHLMFATAVIGSVVVLLALCTVDRRRYPARLLVLLRCEQGEGPLVPVALVGGAAVYWVLAAASSAFVAASVGGSGRAPGLAALATMASSLAGFLALPVPAGMGVREAVFAAVLGPALGAERALAVALVTRALAIVLECLLWLASLAFSARAGRGAGNEKQAPVTD